MACVGVFVSIHFREWIGMVVLKYKCDCVHVCVNINFCKRVFITINYITWVRDIKNKEMVKYNS